MFKFACCLLSLMAWIHPSDAATIHWYTNYEEAASVSNKTNKPLILFFTGSDWCTWCHKLENEVLNQQAFADSVGNQFVFVKLDFPLYAHADPQVKKQNEQLQKKYQVKGFPSLVILNSQEQVMGTCGYREGGPTSYAAYLKNLVGEYRNYQSRIELIPSRSLSGEELQVLLDQSIAYKRSSDRQKIIRAGIDSDRRDYFLLEAYRDLVEEGRVHYPSARKIKRQLLLEDPENKSGIHFQIAVIDFEAYLEEMEKENYGPEFAVAPLISYIKDFGTKDSANLWSLEMLISQVYLDKNHMKEALNHAQSSFKAAPSSIKPKIGIAIKNIQAKTS